MPTVYRIQDGEGRGPFKPGFSKRWVRPRPDHENLMSWFEEFGYGVLGDLPDGVCGSACVNLEQLRRWFTEQEYNTLKMYGYRAVEMQVSGIIAESEIQCFVVRSIPFNKEIKTVLLY